MPPLRRRPSPALVISLIALFLSLGGVSYGLATGSIDSREIRNNTVRTQDLRNNDIRGRDIRNSTVNSRDVAFNTLTGLDINESRLGTVPSAENARNARNASTLDGLDSSAFQTGPEVTRVSARLAAGETRTLASNGPVSIEAECTSLGNDTLTLRASTSTPGAVMGGDDVHNGVGGDFLDPGTQASARELAQDSVAAGATKVTSKADGFVMASDGKALHLHGGAAALGLNYAGAKCLVAGLIVATG